MLRRFRHKISDGEIAGLEFGDPILPFAALFIHATGFNAMTYQSLLAPLGLRAHVAALDMRGHGRTQLPLKKNLPSWTRFRDDVIEWLEKNAPQGVVLCGHSFGGCVALMVAGKRPDLVKGLVLVDPVILTPRYYRGMHLLPFAGLFARRHKMARVARKRRANFSSLAEVRESYTGRGAFATWREPFLDDYVLDGFERTDDNAPNSDDQTWSLLCTPEAEAATFGAQRNRPWGAIRRVRKKKIPMTILRAAKGSVMSDDVAQRILRKNPNAIVKTARGTTHFLPMEAPYLVRDELSAFVSRLVEGFSAGDEGAVSRSLERRRR